MNILEALAQQRKIPDSNNRIMCDDGLLSLSDAVFGVALFSAGYSNDEIHYLVVNHPLDKREQFLKQIGAYE